MNWELDARQRIKSGDASVTLVPLVLEELELIAWSGSESHLENVGRQLERVASGEVDYVTLRVDDVPVVKTGIDFAKEEGAGTIWQLATHPDLEGLGLATRMIAECERRIAERGLDRVRLAVEVQNERAIRLYKHLGYELCGETPEEWEAEDENGERYLYRTTCLQMVKPL